MSVLDQLGDDPRPILDVALEQATPNRISKSWVRHRIEEVIGQLSTVLDEDQIDDTVQAFKRKGLDLATRCTRSSPTKKEKKVPVQPRTRASSSHQSHQDACSPIYSQSRAL